MTLRSRLLFPGLLVLVALACVRLGIWQLHRLHDRRAANEAALRALAAPPAELEAIAVKPDSALAYRRVRVTGRYDRAHEIVLRDMVFNGTPGVQVVTPLQMASGRGVLVKRGFVPAADATSLLPGGLDEPGEVTVSGIALPMESRPDSGTPLMHDGRTTWRRLDLAALRSRMPYPILPVYVLQTQAPQHPVTIHRVLPPTFDDGPHLSYALQWFGFASIALVMAAIFAFRSPARAEARRAPR
jgi:surfeit locus 1 family protein